MSRTLKIKFYRGVGSDFQIFMRIGSAKKPNITSIIDFLNAHGASSMWAVLGFGGAEEASGRFVDQFFDFADGFGSAEILVIFFGLIAIDGVHKRYTNETAQLRALVVRMNCPKMPFFWCAGFIATYRTPKSVTVR